MILTQVMKNMSVKDEELTSRAKRFLFGCWIKVKTHVFAIPIKILKINDTSKGSWYLCTLFCRGPLFIATFGFQNYKISQPNCSLVPVFWYYLKILNLKFTCPPNEIKTRPSKIFQVKNFTSQPVGTVIPVSSWRVCSQSILLHNSCITISIRSFKNFIQNW